MKLQKNADTTLVYNKGRIWTQVYNKGKTLFYKCRSSEIALCSIKLCYARNVANPMWRDVAHCYSIKNLRASFGLVFSIFDFWRRCAALSIFRSQIFISRYVSDIDMIASATSRLKGGLTLRNLRFTRWISTIF